MVVITCTSLPSAFAVPMPSWVVPEPLWVRSERTIFVPSGDHPASKAVKAVEETPRLQRDLNQAGPVFEDGGEHELKGVPDHWHLYRVEVTLHR